jgi:hypothetical protein
MGPVVHILLDSKARTPALGRAPRSSTRTCTGLLASPRDRREDAHPAAPAGIWLPGLPLPARVALIQLRDALLHYQAQRQPADLERAFAAATATVSFLQVPSDGGRPDLEEMRRLASALPEFGVFLSTAAGEAERAVCAGSGGLWRALGLRSAAPRWTPAERDAARMVFACACVPAPDANANAGRLQASLRRIAAGRFAQLLCTEFAGSEDVWVRAFGDRYTSIRHRCARRTTWKSRGLSELLRTDEITRRAVSARLERWMAGGGQLAGLAGELEAALVHARTPPRFA